MWVLFRRLKVREHERGLLFKDSDFKAILRPGRRFVWDPLRKVRMDVVSVRDVWLTHKDLDVIAKSSALADEARVKANLTVVLGEKGLADRVVKLL